MMRILVVLGLALTSCRSEPKLTQRFQRAWFELATPAGWSEEPADGGSRFILELERASPDLVLKVAQPLPTARTPSELLEAQTKLSLKSVPLTTRRPEATTFAGGPGAVVVLDGQRDDGAPVHVRIWAAVRDSQLLWLQCGGTGETPKEPARECQRIAESFRVTGPLPAPVAEAAFEERATSGLKLQVPKGWVTAPPQGFNASFRSAGADIDGAVPTVLVRVQPYPGTREQLEASAQTEPGVVLEGRSPFTLGVGQGLVSRLRFKEGTAGLSYVALANGQAVELVCVLPRAVAELYRPVCDRMAESLRLE